MTIVIKSFLSNKNCGTIKNCSNIQFDSSGTELEYGNYMSYFQKRDGKYVCVRDMTTTTAPVKPGM